MSTLNVFIWLLRTLKLGNRACQKLQTAGAPLLALVLALAAQTLTQGVGQVPVENLTWAATTTLGLEALLELHDEWPALHWKDAHTACTRLVLATSLACVLTLLAIKLGANWAGDLVLHILGGDGRPGWVLVELGLWLVGHTLLRLDDVLALSGPVNDPALKV